MIIKDRVIKYGNNVDTDVIIPARYLNTIDEAELASHCFEDLDGDFKEKAKEKIVKSLKKLGYFYTTIDLEGYTRGSMNRLLKKT